MGDTSLLLALASSSASSELGSGKSMQVTCLELAPRIPGLPVGLC